MTNVINTTIAKVSILALLFSMVFVAVSPARAEMYDSKDTLTRSKISTLSSHEVKTFLRDINNAALDFAAGDVMVFDFAPSADTNEDFAISAATVTSDVSFEIFGTPMTTFDFDVNSASSCTGSTGADEVTISVSATNGTVTVTACESFVQSPATKLYVLEVGTVAGGTNRITNPGVVSTVEDPIYVGIDFTDASNSNNNASTSIGVNIVADDQVIVYGTVEGYMEATLSADTCDLGIIPSSEADPVGGCSYTMAVETNAVSGYNVAVVQGGALTDGVQSITAVADGAVNSGFSEYGVSTSDTTSAINSAGGSDAGCTSGSLATLTAAESAAPLTSSFQQWMTYADEAIGGSPDTERLCHYAAASEALQSGEYSQTVTHIATGTF